MKSSEALLRLNSCEIDEYIKKIKPDIQKPKLLDLKSIRKRIRNREYAKMSRVKNKTKMLKLEEENYILKQRIRELEYENDELIQGLRNCFPEF